MKAVYREIVFTETENGWSVEVTGVLPYAIPLVFPSLENALEVLPDFLRNHEEPKRLASTSYFLSPQPEGWLVMKTVMKEGARTDHKTMGVYGDLASAHKAIEEENNE